MQRGQRNAALDMAGGNEFPSPAGRAFSTNLTPDPTGIAHYDEATFVQVMRTGKLGTLHPVMPWAMISRMTDEDLGALAAQITQHALRQLAYYKAPGYVAFVDVLPLTLSQKVQRAQTKALAQTLPGQPRCIDTRAMKTRQS